MSQGAERSSGASFGAWPAVVLIAGVALVGVGVALNETGVSAGRICIVAGLPVSLAGVVLAVLAQRRPAAPAIPTLSPDACVEEVGRRHQFKPGERGMIGRVKRRRIEISPRDGGVAIRAQVKRALDLGLTVRRGDPEGDARRLVRSGDEPFDGLYTVRGDEPERARALLSERLRGHLVATEVMLDDGGARLVVPPDVEAVEAAMRTAAIIAAEVERASAPVPCASSLTEMRDAWMRFAAAHALATTDTPLATWGRIDGLEVSARSVRDAFQQFHFELAVDFPEPLGRGLAMRPASSSTQFDRSGPPVGHPRFDRFYVLKADVPEDAGRLVGGETREAILELRDHGIQLRVTDKGLWAWVGFRRDDVEAVPKGIVKMVPIARRILDSAGRYPKAAPTPSLRPEPVREP